MRSALVALLLSGAVLLGGCAFTQATLNVGYLEASRGPLASVESRRVEIGPFEDKRLERDKIGWKKNGFGQKTAHIVSSRPVPEIVRDALAVEFMKNGHNVGGAPGDVMLSGEIKTFWFDYQINFWTVDFMGTVEVALSVADGEDGAPLLKRTYQGHYTEKSMGGLEGTWERVMNVALERMVRELSTDSKLLQVLKRERIGSAPAPASGER